MNSPSPTDDWSSIENEPLPSDAKAHLFLPICNQNAITFSNAKHILQPYAPNQCKIKGPAFCHLQTTDLLTIYYSFDWNRSRILYILQGLCTLIISLQYKCPMLNRQYGIRHRYRPAAHVYGTFADRPTRTCRTLCTENHRAFLRQA